MINREGARTVNRILVVDDESLMREFLSESLAAQKYDVDAAENGSRALRSEEHTSELQSL